MIRIDIDDKLAITSDSRNYILSKRHINKTGKNIGDEELIHIGFYRTINDLLNALLTRRARLSMAESFKELGETVRIAQAEIKALAKGL